MNEKVHWEDVPLSKRDEFKRAKDFAAIFEPGYNASLAERARKRMARVDDMPKPMRELVHEFGLEIIWEFWTYNLRDADKVRKLIERTQAEGKYSNRLAGWYIQAGLGDVKRASYLIGAVLASPFPNGQPRYALNKAPNRKPNILNYDDSDDTAFYIAEK